MGRRIEATVPVGEESVTRPGAPVWVAEAEEPRTEGTIHGWRSCFGDDPGASIYQHPDLVLRPSETGRKDPVVISLRGRGPGAEGSARSIALLAPRVIKVQVLPGVPWRIALQGRKLVGDRVLGDADAVSLDALLGATARHLLSSGEDCVLFEDIEVGSPLWDALSYYARHDPRVVLIRPGEPQPHWSVRFPKAPADYWKTFSGKSRYNLRQQAKKLVHTVLRVTEAHQVPAFLEKSHEVSRRSWQGKRLGLRIKNTPEERAFWEAVAGLGAMRCYVLENDAGPLAFVAGVQWKGRYAYEEIAYDPAFAHFSPGRVLLYRLLEDLIAHDTPQVLDFGFGDAEYKQVFGTDRAESGPLLLVRRGLRPLLALRLDRVRRRLILGAKEVLGKLGARAAARRLYRKA